MKTKKMNLVIAVLSLFLVLGIASVVHGQITDSAKLKITVISQEPDPAAPGEIVDVRFKIENLGGDSVQNLVFEILPKYPFSLYTGSAVKSIGLLQAYQQGDEGVILLYKLKVDENAVEGDNYIDVKYKIGDTSIKWVEIKDFVIRVRTADLVLLIDEVKSTPEIIPPGETAKVTFVIKNTADSLVRDLKVKLDLSSDAMPFIPIKSTTEKKIYQLDSKSNTELTFDIMAMADAESGAYKVPLNLSYSDVTGTYYSKSDIISLIVGAKPDLYVGMDKSEIMGSQKSGKLTIKFVNKGLTNIKFLNVKLRESEDYEIVSPAEVYVGNIDSDDYETVDFDIYVKSRKNVITLPLMLEYMDANNNKYTPIKSIELKMYSSSEAKKYGLVKEGSIGTIIIILIVVGGLAIYIWRQKKKGKKIFGRW